MMAHERARRIVAAAAACLCAAAAVAERGDETAGSVEQAVALYDQGRYADVRTILQRLDADGTLTGSLLYRLSYVLAVAGDSAGQRNALERAVAALEQEVATDDTLESGFYLANSFRNLNRGARAREVALAAIARAESGSWNPHDDPVELFRLAKLYADVGRQAGADERYREALEGLEASADAFPIYIRWARRYVGNVAFTRGDYATAEAAYAALGDGGLAEQRDWDRLAVARARLGQWDGAIEAWRASERANPGEADRARYGRHLATQAGNLETLPGLAPDGRPWSALGKADLETLMKAQAERLKEIQAQLAVESVDDDTFAAFENEAATLHGIFVAASLEYALRDLPIRETAFFGGYAPLIFHGSRWAVAPAGE